MKRRRVVNRDRSEYRRLGREDRRAMPTGGGHGDQKKARDKRAARDRRTWED